MIKYLLSDSFVTKRTEEMEQLSAMLASTTSLVHHDVNDIDESMQLANVHLTTHFDELVQQCSQTKVCAS